MKIPVIQMIASQPEVHGHLKYSDFDGKKAKPVNLLKKAYYSHNTDSQEYFSDSGSRRKLTFRYGLSGDRRFWGILGLCCARSQAQKHPTIPGFGRAFLIFFFGHHLPTWMNRNKVWDHPTSLTRPSDTIYANIMELTVTGVIIQVLS
jgi:hypothetical protein